MILFAYLLAYMNDGGRMREKALSEQEVKSKREVHHCLSTFLVLEDLLTVIRTGRQNLPEQARTSRAERGKELPVWCSGAQIPSIT